MTNKFSQFLTENKLDPRRVLSSSSAIERLRPEDRAQRLAKRQARKGGAAPAADAAAAKEAKKPRSGRPVSRPELDAARGGKKLSGPAKTRLLRAVNRLLEQKKKKAVELKALF